jgi:hypothetical protein
MRGTAGLGNPRQTDQSEFDAPMTRSGGVGAPRLLNEPRACWQNVLKWEQDGDGQPLDCRYRSGRCHQERAPPAVSGRRAHEAPQMPSPQRKPF